MPFVAAPNIVSVEVRAVLDGQHIENRFTIDVLAEPTEAIVTLVAETVLSWVDTDYADTQPAEVEFTEVVATSLHSIDGPQHTATYAVPTAGAVGGGSMPNETSFCASLRSGSRGRSARGRVYQLAVPRSVVTGNNVDGTYAAGMITVWESLRSVINDNEWLWVIVSYISEGIPRPGGPVYYTIATISYTDLIVDSQRRRKPGVGA